MKRIIFILTLVAIVSCKKESIKEPAITNHIVYYQLTGDALKADITYLNESGATIELNQVDFLIHHQTSL